jgi:hypothetical protein
VDAPYGISQVRLLARSDGEGCGLIDDDAVDVRDVAKPPGGSADHLGEDS